MAVNKILRRQKIRYKIRKKLNGSAPRPRLSIFRSNKAIYAQIINDDLGHTLIASSSRELSADSQNKPKCEVARLVGIALAEKAKNLGINSVVFDRSGYLYHGRVKSLAEGAREGGLNF